MPRQLGIHFAEQCLEAGSSRPTGVDHSAIDIDPGLREQALVALLTPKAAMIQVATQSCQWIALGPRLGILRFESRLGQGLDEGSALTRRCPLARSAYGMEDCDDIATVHAHPTNAVGNALDRKPSARGLPRGRRAHRSAVVATQRDDRRPVDARKVEARVEIRAARGSVPKENKGCEILAPNASRPGHTHRVRNLGADERAHARDASTARKRRKRGVTPAGYFAPRAERPAKAGQKGHPAPERGRRFARRKKEPVLVSHRGSSADNCRLLSQGTCMLGNVSLALKGHHALVESARKGHVLVKRHYEISRKVPFFGNEAFMLNLRVRHDGGRLVPQRSRSEGSPGNTLTTSPPVSGKLCDTMAWRVLVSSPTSSPEPLPRAGRPSGAPHSRSSHGLRTSVSPPPRPTSIAPLSAGQSMLPDVRRSMAPATQPDGVSTAACVQLLDRLLLADQAPFVLSWIENTISTRNRSDPAIAARLLRTYRENGKLDRARDLAASLPNMPVSWPPLELARLGIERAILATIDGRPDHAEAELRLASRALGAAPKGAGLREQLDMHVAQAQLEATLDRADGATQSLRLAELVADRIEDGAWRAPVAMTLGHISMKLADPRTAAKHYAAALARMPSRAAAAMNAHGNLAIALGSVGQFDDGRRHALSAIDIARDSAPGWRHADACDVLAIVEIAADQPLTALQNLDEGLGVLGDFEHPMLRYQLTEHRAWALAMLGRAAAARQWLAKAERLRSELGAVDLMEDQDLVSTRARTLEASDQPQAAIDVALEHAEQLPEAFVTGSLNLTIGRCALALGDEARARTSVERAALSGERHGWIFPDRRLSISLWQLALKCGDSRVVRYAERMIHLVDKTNTRADILSLLPSSGPSAVPVSIVPMASSEGGLEPAEGEVFVYVTTPQGVTRVALSDLRQATDGATLVVDTLTHALRVHDREVSLERRRALEPLVVQLLRRAREGLSAEEILRAAGGPGPESADAEHRVRVLVSRVRDLLGDAASIERVRDAGEHGRTRYRLSADARFALVEPLYSPTIPPG